MPNIKEQMLYSVPNGSHILLGDMQLLFHHIDGAYSYCTDDSGGVHHIHACAPVVVLSGEKE